MGLPLDQFIEDINPVKIIFGGKNLFEKLKKHLQGKKRKKTKKKQEKKNTFMLRFTERFRKEEEKKNKCISFSY